MDMLHILSCAASHQQTHRGYDSMSEVHPGHGVCMLAATPNVLGSTSVNFAGFCTWPRLHACNANIQCLVNVDVPAIASWPPWQIDKAQDKLDDDGNSEQQAVFYSKQSSTTSTNLIMIETQESWNLMCKKLAVR